MIEQASHAPPPAPPGGADAIVVKQVPPPPPPPGAMKPGTYIRKRRLAAGLEIDAVALMLGTTPNDRATVRNQLIMMEADQGADHGLLVTRLQGAFPFDPYVYFALVDAAADPGMPVPHVCRVCACSWHDACDSADGPCAWTPGDSNLCTSCDGKEPDDAA